MKAQHIVLLVGDVRCKQESSSQWSWVPARSVARATHKLTVARFSAVVLAPLPPGEDLRAAVASLESAQPEVPIIALVSRGPDLGSALEAAISAGCDDAIFAEEVSQRLLLSLRKNIARAQRTERARVALAQQIAVRTRALRDTNRELQAFTYAVSHDLREPLRSLEGFSLALLEDYGPQLQGEGALYIERIRAATRRLSHRVDALLGLSRATQNEMRCESVNLSVFFEEAFARLMDRSPERSVDLYIEPGIMMRADPDLCRVLVENLSSNAWKFTRDTHATIRFERIDDEVVCLSDTGCGFDPSYNERIFAAFGRYHTTHEYEGTGIGLTTVQRIVHRHGGSIRAQGTLGGGAKFFFTLPGLECTLKDSHPNQTSCC